MRPVLITPPAERPVDPATIISNTETLAGASVEVVGGLIDAAVSHLDGWTGSLGRCLVTQTWRMEFGTCSSRLHLPFCDVLALTGVSVDGAPLSESSYKLSRVVDGFHVVRVGGWPSGEIAVEFTAGYGAADAVPVAIKHAIVLMVSNLYSMVSTAGQIRSEQVEGVSTVAFNSPEQSMGAATKAVDFLLSPFRRIEI